MSVSSSSSTNNETIPQEDESPTTMRVPPFVVDQRVFANDSDTLYEAIVRKASWSGQQWTFLVHYLGWNARWDKWLEETQLHADTAEMRQQASLQQQGKRKRQDESAALSSSRKKKVERGPSFTDYCELPFTLKTILIEDRERIMRMGFDAPSGLDCCSVTNWRPARDVHHLPARVSVKTVLDYFVKTKKKQEEEKAARDFCQNLATLFDESLVKCLLYPPERAQYDALSVELAQKRKCEVYGCEFLLRLLVRLDVLLQDSGSNRKQLGTQIADLIVLLQKNRQVCFKAKYREPKEEELNEYEKALRHGSAPVAMDE